MVGGVLLEMNGKRYDNTLRHRWSTHAALTAEAWTMASLLKAGDTSS